MIELLASAPDGWAFVRDRGQLWLVRPPFRESDRERMTRTQAAHALADEDFVEDPHRFTTWNELGRYLADLVVECATPEILARSPEAAAHLLARATAEEARAHLWHLNAALGVVDPSRVRTAALALLASEAVKREPQLLDELSRLLAHIEREGGRAIEHERPE